MAKGLRSSVKKHNRALLRKEVFGPVVDARTERLSAKLRELAGVSKDAAMTDVDPRNSESAEDKTKSESTVKDAAEPIPLKIEGGLSRKTGRIEKRSRRKPRNTITFAPHPGKAKRANASKKR